jgi:hypothetical protein
MFVCGAAFGAAIATGLLVSYFIYRQQAGAQPPIGAPVFQVNHGAK